MTAEETLNALHREGLITGWGVAEHIAEAAGDRQFHAWAFGRNVAASSYFPPCPTRAAVLEIIVGKLAAKGVTLEDPVAVLRDGLPEYFSTVTVRPNDEGASVTMAKTGNIYGAGSAGFLVSKLRNYGVIPQRGES